jgi:hypothetical protein
VGEILTGRGCRKGSTYIMAAWKGRKGQPQDPDSGRDINQRLQGRKYIKATGIGR